MPIIKIKISDNFQDFAKWLSKTPEAIQLKIDERIPYIRRSTKKEVQNHLTIGHGVDEGIYKKSFKINNYAQSKWEVAFQVYAKDPHYRLTHLLEYGHRIKVFRWGQGEPTKRGNVGMVFINSLRHGTHTEAIPHIAPAQKYADDKVYELYDKTIDKKFTERMRIVK